MTEQIFHPSDSLAQRASEITALKALNKQLGLNLKTTKVDLPDKACVQIDGFDPNAKIACEIYSHIGRLKGSQPDKLASDILKLLLVEKHLGGTWRKVICFVDDQAALCLTNASWLASTRDIFEIEVVMVPVGDATRQSLLDAQSRQKMVNVTG